MTAEDALRAAGQDRLAEAFRANGGEGKPIHVQMAVSWAPTLKEARDNCVDQWSSAAIGGEAAWDLRRPQDFDTASRGVTAEALAEAVLITDSIDRVGDAIGEIEMLGAAAVHLHMVGRDQEAFIDEVGRSGLLASR